MAYCRINAYFTVVQIWAAHYILPHTYYDVLLFSDFNLDREKDYISPLPALDDKDSLLENGRERASSYFLFSVSTIFIAVEQNQPTNQAGLDFLPMMTRRHDIYLKSKVPSELYWFAKFFVLDIQAVCSVVHLASRWWNKLWSQVKKCRFKGHMHAENDKTAF